MRIGAALFLIAVGAILKWAVTDSVNGVNLQMVGVILMIIGALGLLFEVIMMTTRRRTDIIHHNRGVTYVAPNDPVERY